jgi:hypothetical protein
MRRHRVPPDKPASCKCFEAFPLAASQLLHDRLLAWLLPPATRWVG